MDADAPPEDDKPEPSTAAGREALDGLRAIWAATGQFEPGLECADDERGCSANVNFDAFADTVEPTTDTAEAIHRLRSAWKATLAKDGKLYDPRVETDPADDSSP